MDAYSPAYQTNPLPVSISCQSDIGVRFVKDASAIFRYLVAPASSVLIRLITWLTR